MSTIAGMRLRNESKDEADELEPDSSRWRRLDGFRESLQRFGSAVKSSSSMILRLEKDLLDQMNSVEIIETHLLKVEEKLIGETGEMPHLDEASGESPSVLGSESSTPTEPESDLEGADRSPQIHSKSSNSTKLLQKSISGNDSQKKTKSISCRSSNSLDFDLLQTVFQCVMALSQASRARQVEASCRLIQRIFRGYVVRRDIEVTERRSFNVSRMKRSESLALSEDVDQVFTNGIDHPSTNSTEELNSMTSSPVTSPKVDDITSGVETTIQEENRKSKQFRKFGLAKFIYPIKHSPQRMQDAQRQQPQHQQHQQQQHRASLPSIPFPSSSRSHRFWSASGTSAECNDSDDGFVRGRRESLQLQTFLFSKISEQKERLRKKQPSVPDIIFCQTLEDIHNQLTNRNSTESTEKTSDVNYSYNDLMSNFEVTLDEKMNLQIASEQFINAFRTILNEFLKKKSLRNKEPSNEKPKKETNKKKTKTMQAIIESAAAGAAEGMEGGAGHVTFQSAARCSSSAPEFVTQLMDEVESRGLYVVGIYRKTGNAAKIKQLIKDFDSHSADVDFTLLEIHVMTSVLKSFLRNLPQPLIAFHVYEELSQLPNDVTAEERTRMLNDLYSKLPPDNQKLLDRLLSHLARVALNESTNLMSTNALAITFTPCLLRLPNENSLSIEDLKSPVQRQNEFLQLLIEAKLQELTKEKEEEEEEEEPETNLPDVDDVSVDSFAASGTSDDVIGEENHSFSNVVYPTDVSHDVVDDAFAADDDRDADHVTDSSSTDEETSGGTPDDLRPL